MELFILGLFVSHHTHTHTSARRRAAPPSRGQPCDCQVPLQPHAVTPRTTGTLKKQQKKQFSSIHQSPSITHTHTHAQQHQHHMLHSHCPPPTPHPTSPMPLPRPPGSAVTRHLQPQEARWVGVGVGGLTHPPSPSPPPLHTSPHPTPPQ